MSPAVCAWHVPSCLGKRFTTIAYGYGGPQHAAHHLAPLRGRCTDLDTTSYGRTCCFKSTGRILNNSDGQSRLLKRFRLQGRSEEETGAYWVVREDFRRASTQQMDFFSDLLAASPGPATTSSQSRPRSPPRPPPTSGILDVAAPAPTGTGRASNPTAGGRTAGPPGNTPETTRRTA